MQKKLFTQFEKKVWLSSPTKHKEVLEYVTEAYETNWMSTLGKNIDVIEELIAKRVGCKYAVALASGTSTLHLCMKLAGVKPGDRVFVSDMTFIASVNPIVYEGGIPIFIDSEKDTWNISPIALERAFELYPDVKVVVAVNLYGTPCKLDEISKICQKHGAILIEDAAESLGSVHKGKMAGSYGKYNAISFNGNKIITGSSGGMFLTDDEEASKKVRKLSTQARDNAPWYHHTEMGYNYRMSNVVAGVVRGNYKYLDEHIAQKKAIYFRYKEAFKDLPIKMNPYLENDSLPNFWLSCMTINKEAMAKQERSDTVATFVQEKGKTCPTEILATLAKYNAEGRPIWKPMHMQPLYKDNIFVKENENEPAINEDIFERGLCLPSDNKMTKEDQDKIIEMVKSCFE